HDHIVADRTIVGDVGLSHQKAIVAYSGQSATSCGTTVDRNELAYMISSTDVDRSGFAAIFQVLWRETDRSKRIHVGAVANVSLAVDHDVRFQAHIVAEDHVIADNAKRTYEVIGPDLCLMAGDCALVDKRRHVKNLFGRRLIRCRRLSFYFGLLTQYEPGK